MPHKLIVLLFLLCNAYCYHIGVKDSLRHPACLKVCAGNTSPGLGWVRYADIHAYVDVDMTFCGFLEVPYITSSLHGTTNHWHTRGSSEPYSTTKTGFRFVQAVLHYDIFTVVTFEIEDTPFKMKISNFEIDCNKNSSVNRNDNLICE